MGENTDTPERREETAVRVRIVVDDGIPAAAAFTVGSTAEGAAEITVNLAFHIACARIFGEPLPEVLATSLAHELMHVAQEIGRYGFTEEVVHASTDAAAAMQLTVEDPPTPDEAVQRLAAAEGAANSYQFERNQAWAENDALLARLRAAEEQVQALQDCNGDLRAQLDAQASACEGAMQEAANWRGRFILHAMVTTETAKAEAAIRAAEARAERAAEDVAVMTNLRDGAWEIAERNKGRWHDERARAERYRGALERYGRHRPDCRTFYPVRINDPMPVCDCGWDVARALADRGDDAAP